MDSIAKALGITPQPQVFFEDLEKTCSTMSCSSVDVSPFNSEWFKPIRVENGKNSNLVKEWNGSTQQKEFLQRTLKNRKINWGDQITNAKSHGPYSIDLDGVLFTTLSINKFAKEHGLNFSSLRNSLSTKQPVRSKNHTVTVIKA
jgi:hypothetical protein